MCAVIRGKMTEWRDTAFQSCKLVPWTDERHAAWWTAAEHRTTAGASCSVSTRYTLQLCTLHSTLLHHHLLHTAAAHISPHSSPSTLTSHSLLEHLRWTTTAPSVFVLLPLLVLSVGLLPSVELSRGLLLTHLLPLLTALFLLRCRLTRLSALCLLRLVSPRAPRPQLLQPRGERRHLPRLLPRADHDDAASPVATAPSPSSGTAASGWRADTATAICPTCGRRTTSAATGR